MRPTVCPNCGAEVPPNAKACPGCGSDEKTGWSEYANIGALNLPDEEFNYDEFAEREWGHKKKVVPRGIKVFWWTVAVLLIGLFFWGIIHSVLRAH